MMMFGSRVRFGITYKSNQPGFQIYTRKYFHNFKVAISNENYEGAQGCNLPSINAYIISEKKKIGVYSCLDYKPIQTWNVPASTEDSEILYINVSKDDKKIGVAMGRHVIKDQYKLTEIMIYAFEEDLGEY